MSTRSVAVALVVALVAACVSRGPREYELRGVVVAVDPARQEITIKHEDIPRFMPGMTMAFKVGDPKLLTGRVPGDVVRATLVVEDSSAHLRTLERTGSAPVPDAPAPSAANTLGAGDAVPDTRFVDQDGTPRRLADWRGQALAVTFMYTRCPLPDFCPLMDRHFKIVQDAIRQDQELRARAHLLSISFDPTHDRPPILAAHAKRLAADPATWSFLTFLPGDNDGADRFASPFGVSILRKDSDGNELVHNLRTAVIDPDGRLSAVLNGNEWVPQQLLAELRKALGRPAGH